MVAAAQGELAADLIGSVLAQRLILLRPPPFSRLATKVQGERL
jgi:hypothetical protein